MARAAAGAGRRRISGTSCAGSTSGCRTTRSWPTARATMRHGCIGSIAIAASGRSSRRIRARWATAFRPRSQRSSCIPSGSSSRGTATAAIQMNGQELATAVQYRLAIVFVVIDNAMYGTIRMHQERTYPGARVGHVARESGFRGARARLRRARRDSRSHRGIRAGLRARAGERRTGAAAREDRSSGADDERVAGSAAGDRQVSCYSIKLQAHGCFCCRRYDRLALRIICLPVDAIDSHASRNLVRTRGHDARSTQARAA